MSNLLRVFTERVHPDNRVSRVIIDINHRSQVHIDTECFELASCRLRYLVCNLLRTDSSQSHIPWKYGGRLPKSLHDTVLLVNANEHRIPLSPLPTNLLQPPGQ